MIRLTAAVWMAVALVAWPATGAAQSVEPYAGEQSETWKSPPTRTQLDQDGSVIPAGKGAIFVPSMTDPTMEPSYVVEREPGGELVKTLPMGSKAVVSPGIYRVRLGSGTVADRIVRRVLVEEGRTTVVPATWSGFVVNVVDERAIPFRGQYEVIRLPDRTGLGVGLGADAELGEEVRTWILRPGQYMLIRPGATYQARRDFYTFRLRAGELWEVTLVLDRDEGTFLGAGDLPSLQEKTTRKDWDLNLVIGGDVEGSQRTAVVGFESGFGLAIGGFVDFVSRYHPRKHLVYMRFKLEEKQVKLPNQPFQKDLDELRLDAIYTYRLLPWMGPYVRAGGQTALFPNFMNFREPTEVVRVDAAGAEIESLGTHDGQFKMARPLAPVELRGGTGMSFLVRASDVVDASVRLGLGGRALFNRDLLNAVPRDDTPAFEVHRQGDAFQFGLELAIFGTARLGRWILLTTEFELLEPFGALDKPIVDWETTVGLRLVSFASINYLFKLVSDVDRSPGLQTEHRLLLRFNWRIL